MMNTIFSTWFVAIFGIILVILYCLYLIHKKRIKEINLPDAGSVWFQGSSICAGLKLSLVTFLTTYNTPSNTFEGDKIYVMYGGVCVIVISLKSLWSKVK